MMIFFFGFCTFSSSLPFQGDGWLGFLAGPLESALQIIEGGLEGLHVPYAYGFAIIMLTVIIKIATLPLSQKQVESTIAMQVLQPKIKELQAKYTGNQEELQLQTAKLYREAEVNPLAGCLPSLVTLPVWIGLYKALSHAADDGLLVDGFFWIPTLSGPVSAGPDGGLSWLLPLQEATGAPAVGWDMAAAYLVLPVLLIVSQYISQEISTAGQPKSEDPSQQQVQNVLKFLPLMIGWFSLNVPSGLTLYWFVNNILTTVQQVVLKSMIKPRLELELNAKIAAVAAARQPVVLTPEQREQKQVEKKKVKAAGTSGVETNARGKKKGKKFAERKAKEGKTVKQAKTTTTTTAAAAGASSDGDEVVVEAEVMERAE